MNIINLNEGTDIGGYLSRFTSAPREKDSFQKELIKGLMPFLDGLNPVSEPVLEVGCGTNFNIMREFAEGGYIVHSVDDTDHKCDIPGIKFHDCNVLDFNPGINFGLIYFWGSWSSSSSFPNYSVSDNNLDWLIKKGLLERKGSYDDADALLGLDLTIKKCKSLLKDNGKVMIVTSDLARHGGGYDNLEGVFKDYNNLLDLLKNNGFSKVYGIGLSKNYVINNKVRQYLTGRFLYQFNTNCHVNEVNDKIYSLLNKRLEYDKMMDGMKNIKLDRDTVVFLADYFNDCFGKSIDSGKVSNMYDFINEGIKEDMNRVLESLASFAGSDVVMPYIVIGQK